MSGKRDIGYVADVIVTLQKANLQTKQNTLEAEYADGIRQPHIPDANFYISEIAKPPSFPFMQVIPDRTEVPRDGEFRYDIEYHFLTINMAMSSEMTAIKSTAEEDLKRQLMRGIRAAEEVILDAPTMNGSVDDIVVFDKSFGPMFTKGNALLQEGQIDVRALTLTQ